MAMPPIQAALRVLSPAWLTGPILGKELRVSSRRRRNYLLRVLYLAVLSIFVALIWIQSTRSYNAANIGYRISRMASAGKEVIMAVAWVQFCAAQLLSVVMLSTAISEEIHHRTLAALMSTPVNSLQVVLGKLLSKLLQILLLLAISLPVLAVVRVFGGVPWGFVLASVCVTLTAVIFAGSISLLLSVYSRRSYTVIVGTLVLGLVIYILVPWVLAMAFFRGPSPAQWVLAGLIHTNPFAMMIYLSQELLIPGRAAGGMPFLPSWPVHCLIMLGLSALILGYSVKVVRRTALRQAGGQVGRSGGGPRRKASPVVKGTGTARPDGAVRSINGSPVVWKELHSVGGHWSRGRRRLLMAMAVGLLVITYGLCLWGDSLDDDDVHVAYGVVLTVFALLSTVTGSATGIPVEKESQSWPILLSTTLSDWEIVLGKMAGAVRRSSPAWWLLIGHVLLFAAVGIIRPVALVHVMLLASGSLVLLAGLGAYVGSRMRRASAAVVVCFGVALGIWAIGPALLGLACEAFDLHYDTLEMTILPNPVVQIIVILEATAGRGGGELRYHWPDADAHALSATTARIAATAAAHCAAGLFLAWCAKRRFRLKVF